VRRTDDPIRELRLIRSCGDIAAREKLRAAKALGLSVPYSLLARADAVICGHKGGVCTENSNADIMVMQSAKDRVGMDTSSSLNWARERRVLI
jgi:hypothetical protein